MPRRSFFALDFPSNRKTLYRISGKIWLTSTLGQSIGNEPIAKGVLKGITFSIDLVGLKRQMEVPDRNGKIRIQEETLQFSKITDIAEESTISKRRGTVTFLSSIIFLIGAFLAIVTSSVLIRFGTGPITGTYGDIGIGLLLIILSVVVVRKYRKIDRYYQVVSPQITIEDLQEWQIQGDKHGKDLERAILPNLKR